MHASQLAAVMPARLQPNPTDRQTHKDSHISAVFLLQMTSQTVTSIHKRIECIFMAYSYY